MVLITGARNIILKRSVKISVQLDYERQYAPLLMKMLLLPTVHWSVLLKLSIHTNSNAVLLRTLSLYLYFLNISLLLLISLPDSDKKK